MAFQVGTLGSARNSAHLDTLEVTMKSLVEEMRAQSRRLEGFVQLFETYLKYMVNVSIQIPDVTHNTTAICRFKPQNALS